MVPLYFQANCWLIFIGLIGIFRLIAGQQCGPPPVPLGAKFELSTSSGNSNDPNQLYRLGTVVTFSCEPGYELIGSATITCGDAGRWQGETPICGSNVALRKNANQSSTARGGSALNAIDGDRSVHHDVGGTGGRCSETNKESSPWWMVDLMKPFSVNAVRITTRTCCDYPLHDIEIRVGNNTSPQRNQLCAWLPDTVGNAETRTFQCAKPLTGQFVFVQMVGVEGSLSLCEVEVYSAGGDIPRESCTDSAALDKVLAFNRTCYEFHLNEGNSFAKARAYCVKQKGDIWHHVTGRALELIVRELEKKKHTMKTQMVWLGAQKESTFTSRTWRWVSGDTVEKPTWGREQPNNYNGEQNCVVLDGVRDWLWNDVGCNIDYFHWICMFPPLTCGHPDRNVNSTVIGSNFSVGASIEYQCPTGSVTIGSSTRTCLTTGKWSDTSPTCKHVDCGPLQGISNGQLHWPESRTTFNATVEYSCAQNYTLVGATKRTCTKNGAWEPEKPQCLYGRCPELPLFERGSIVLSGLTAGDTATYVCDLGHRLVGEKTLKCELGGRWSADPPLCRFVDCGPLPKIEHGHLELTNRTTTFASHVMYSCDQDYELEGEETRICQEDGTWSKSAPLCMLIECGEPEVPTGGFVTGFDFTIHSQIEYHCEKGHLLKGQRNRVCLNSGSWSGEAPSCNFVDCGPLADITNGEIQYTNDTTYLGSEATYSCNQNYRLEGSPVRRCSEDGKWSGAPPQCREIRCSLPERPDGSILSISSSDRLRAITLLRATDREVSSTSFRIGSTVVYKCERGFRLDGKNSRTCNIQGQWSGEVPLCTYVDCGSPQEVAHGRVGLPNNGTYLGTYAQYNCETNYKLEGFERRMCLENGSWSGTPPICKEITCIPPTADNSTGLIISVTGKSVGSITTYSCREGRRLVGSSVRKCLKTGLWEGSQPFCEYVDCSQPEELDNGRVFLVNGTTIFESLAEYHCVPGFQRQGPFTRQCGADGKWAGTIPSCVEIQSVTPLQDNGLDSLSSERQGNGIGIGIWVGVGTGAALVFLLLIVLIYFKMKRGSWIWGKSAYPKQASKKRSVSMSPPNIPLPPTPHTQYTSPLGHQSSPHSNTGFPYSNGGEIYEHLPGEGENHHMYDLTYEDTRGVRHSANPIGGIPSRPRSPPPSPPPTIGGVTVNGFALG